MAHAAGDASRRFLRVGYLGYGHRTRPVLSARTVYGHCLVNTIGITDFEEGFQGITHLPNYALYSEKHDTLPLSQGMRRLRPLPSESSASLGQQDEA